MFVSGWESPSNRLLTALYQTGSNDVAAAQYTMEAPPIVPDPASHRRGSTARLWDFREGILPKLEAWYRKHLAKDASESDATSAGKNSLAGETNDAASAHGTAPLAERGAREEPLPPTDIGAAKMVGWIFAAILVLAILFASL